MSSSREFVSHLMTAVGGAGLGDGLAKFFEALADGDRTLILTAAGALTGGPLLAAGVLVAGVTLQIRGARRSDKQQREQFAEIAACIRASDENVDQLAESLQPFIDRQDYFLARLPGYEKAQLAGIITDRVKEALAPFLPAGSDTINWDDVRIFLTNNDRILREIQSTVDGIDERTERIADMLTTGRAALPAIPTGVTNNLANAFIQRNPDFVGRQELLARLHERLTAGENAALTHALSAEGGVGKTEVAIEYVHHPKYAPHWAGIWWLDASQLSVERSLELLLARLGYPPQPGDDPQRRRHELVARLADGRHLVVLDNIDHPDTLRSFCFTPTTRVIATTRLTATAIPPTMATTLQVDLLHQDDAARLLIKHRDDLRDPGTGLPATDARPHIDAIVNELDRHALAIGYAAAKLRIDEGLSPAALLEMLRAAEVDAAEHAFAEMGDDETGRRYGRKVAATLLLHLPELEAEDPLVAPVLLAAALCHPTDIPASLLGECVGAPLDAVRKVLLRLRNRSIIRFDAARGADGRGLASAHRLTLSAVRARANQADTNAVADMLEALLKICNAMFDNPKQPERWPTQNEAMPHALACIERLPIVTIERARLLNQIAVFLQTHGRATEAEPLYMQALEMRQRLFTGDHEDIAACLSNIGSLRHALGRAGEAELLILQALEMLQRLFPGDHRDIARNLSSLASVRGALGRATEAEALHEQALEMRRCLFTDDHQDIAQSLNNLAFVRYTLGRAAEAEPLHKLALAMRRRLFTGDHPEIADSLNNLAFVQQALGRAEEAEPLYIQALGMRQRLFIGDHPGIAESLNNLAFVQQELGRVEEAVPLYKQALEMWQRLCNTGDHPRFAMVLNNLGTIKGEQGRCVEAVAYHEKAVAMARRCLPHGHPELLGLEATLAHARKALNRE